LQADLPNDEDVAAALMACRDSIAGRQQGSVG
jgi:hypothetical protein